MKYLAQLENGRAIYRSASLLKIFHATLGKLTSLEVCAVKYCFSVDLVLFFHCKEVPTPLGAIIMSLDKNGSHCTVSRTLPGTHNGFPLITGPKVSYLRKEYHLLLLRYRCMRVRTQKTVGGEGYHSQMNPVSSNIVGTHVCLCYVLHMVQGCPRFHVLKFNPHCKELGGWCLEVGHLESN